MNFDPSDDDRMLADLAERFVADRYDIERRRRYLAEPVGFSGENWALLAELGLIAAPLAPEHGGMGLERGAIVALFTALGRGLVVEPLIETVLVGARLLGAGANVALAADWLADLADGTRRAVLADAEPASRGTLDFLTTTATPVAGGWQLTGSKPAVPAGVGAAGYLVTARSPDGAAPGLWLVPADTPGVTLRPWRMIDGSAAVVLDLADVVVPGDHALGAAAPLLDQVLPLADLARAAEAVGIMQRLFDETLDHLRTRHQFNSPLGRFQAIQHRMVAHYGALEQSRALLDLALAVAGEAAFAKAVAGARAFISEASVALGHDMIQFHGGMGVTDDLAIGHGHKRLVLLSRWPEDPLAKLDAYAALAA